MELSLNGADSRRGVARNHPVMVRFGQWEHALVSAAAGKASLDFATFVRCAALTYAGASGAVPADPVDTRQLPLAITVPSVPLARAGVIDRAMADGLLPEEAVLAAARVAKPRKARSAEAPARAGVKAPLSATKKPKRKATPTPKKQSRKRGGK